MKKGNVIDLLIYKKTHALNSLIVKPSHPISEELKSAIEDLINRLRDPGPVKQP